MHVVLIALNCYTSQSSIATDFTRLTKETMPSVESIMEKLLKVNLAAVMNMNTICHEVMTSSFNIINVLSVIMKFFNANDYKIIRTKVPILDFIIIIPEYFKII